jgi:hypothetical protein
MIFTVKCLPTSRRKSTRRVVEHQRCRRPGIEIEEAGRLVALPLQVLTDLLGRQQRPLGTLTRRVADQPGAAAHQHDRLVPAALQVRQQHQRQGIAHLHAGRRGVKPAVHRAGARGEVGLEIGRRLLHEAAPAQFGKETGHGAESYEGPPTLASARRGY